jgi:hypothetical protein
MTRQTDSPATARCGAMSHHGRCILTSGHDTAIEHLYATPATPVPAPDTLPAWLYKRFGRATSGVDWDELYETDVSFWVHEAAAVRRAVARSGFKDAGAQR